MIAFFVMHVSINAVLTNAGKILADGSVSPDMLEGTRYFSGEFIFMISGLLGAALARWGWRFPAGYWTF